MPRRPASADRADVAARLLAAGETCRDGWLPVHGTESAVAPEEATVGKWRHRLLELARQLPGVIVLDADHDDYPANLQRVEGRPSLLFVDGGLESQDRNAVAVVGSRDANHDVVETTQAVAAALAERRFTIVSGLARGVDAAAHFGAVNGGGRTIAVMGTGIGEIYPPEHFVLAARIKRAGALISQFPPGYGPTKTTFPARNAVIAGLSLGSLIISAAERSGTRIEINHTLAQRRPVLLWAPVLGSQRWAKELATNRLVRFVESAEEIDVYLSSHSAA